MKRWGGQDCLQPFERDLLTDCSHHQRPCRKLELGLACRTVFEPSEATSDIPLHGIRIVADDGYLGRVCERFWGVAWADWAPCALPRQLFQSTTGQDGHLTKTDVLGAGA